jgi:thioredoxin-related protein
MINKFSHLFKIKSFPLICFNDQEGNFFLEKPTYSEPK